MTNADDKSETSRQASVPREVLFAQFNQAITTVRSYSNQLESEIGRPAVRSFFEISEERPILAAFLAILSALSFFPILTFVTASVVTLVCFVALALVISFTVTIGFLFILVSTLVALGFIAAIITGGCFNVYLAFRLFGLVRQKGASEGFLCWIGEIWSHFGSITLPFTNYITHQANPAVIQQLPGDDSDPDTKRS